MIRSCGRGCYDSEYLAWTVIVEEFCVLKVAAEFSTPRNGFAVYAIDSATVSMIAFGEGLEVSGRIQKENESDTLCDTELGLSPSSCKFPLVFAHALSNRILGVDWELFVMSASDNQFPVRSGSMVSSNVTAVCLLQHACYRIDLVGRSSPPADPRALWGNYSIFYLGAEIG
eukprot:CAMPEP_0116567658 /NCGR_PEP_ID=MMETSP0397-20121206/15135_1 /TAXON_ID=216820 /ORGANISM="Cyclophora tenuis, Strain ECT3854" /LENGTH=171 /DNA_ID=CAMNT_0004094685 /DNA_START=54 /DNA_END=566 /DNA_ORIENTATION=+